MNIVNPNTQVVTPFVQINFAPYGIAVDSVRGRVYVSNHLLNFMVVYNTSGTILGVIT